MPLDFAILSNDGTPNQTVPLSMELHDELMSNARELKLYRILKFHDYFEDVDTSPIELAGLQQEILSLQRTASTRQALRFLLELYRLTELAVGQGQTIYAIAD
ncbi:hypothetical protein [Duganella sp. BuS-21]|uniref:hypothetical protein n=1 Tax=Duganella sp. BuS-21 TaxID=2943848 RepID=UPI0035A6A4DA